MLSANLALSPNESLDDVSSVADFLWFVSKAVRRSDMVVDGDEGVVVDGVCDDDVTVLAVVSDAAAVP